MGKSSPVNHKQTPLKSRLLTPLPTKRSCSRSSRGGAASTMSSVAASSLLSGAHGRQRRQERNIQKVDLQRARRYGMKESARYGRVKYTLGGTVFIYDPVKNKEITSYPAPDAIGQHSGSALLPPILLQKRHAYTRPDRLQQHEEQRQRVWQNKERWKSHSVLVVDMSGSMRKDDVSGALARSDAVWMALARDYLQHQLEGQTCCEWDVVSVVLMRETAHCVLTCEPMDWVLYNKFLEFRQWETMRPGGAGCYLPALEKAQELLNINTLGSCALALLFFSDGRPSDSRANFKEKMGLIAATFGKRLSVTCIGMAEPEENFDTLRDMVKEAEAFGASATFERPERNTVALSTAVSTLATSLAHTKIAMTSLRRPGGRQKIVRTDFLRERKNAPDDLAPTADWHIYHNTSELNYVRRLWQWDVERDDFVYLMDSRCIFCYKTVSVGAPGSVQFHGGAMTRGAQCPDCKACFICVDCIGKHEHRGTKYCSGFLSDRRSKSLVYKQVPSFSVAMKRSVFGEGAERIVRKFRFLDDNDQFVGKRWVAKESRFIEEEEEQHEAKCDGFDDYQERMDYHREFARTQVLAAQFAHKFNAALDKLQDHFDPSCHAWLRSLPRIRFLSPLVVELVHNGKPRNILIEEMLEGQYTKFNNNMGYVLHQKRAAFRSLNDDDPLSSDDEEDELEVIDEEKREGSTSNLDEFGRKVKDGIATQIFSAKESSPLPACHYRNVRDKDIPQAFSHFTYEKSMKRLLVVDLQGVLSVRADGTKEFVLTDPAIHKRKKKKGSAISRLGYLGRTDRGEKGMRAFFDSHVCTEACSLLGLVQKLS